MKNEELKQTHCSGGSRLNDGLGAKKHAREDFREWEQYVTCCHCAKPLDDNQRMKDSLKVNTTASWAKRNLKILSEMAEDRGLPKFFVDELNRIKNGITLIPDAPPNA